MSQNLTGSATVQASKAVINSLTYKNENISESMLGVHDIKDTVKQVKEELFAIKSEMNKKNEEDKPTGVFGNLFGNRK